MAMRNYAVPLEFQSKTTSTDPYIFGYWLGLGTSNKSPTSKYVQASERDCIPDEYKFNDRRARLSLLAGLLDSRSCVVGNSHYHLSAMHKQLSNDVVFLCRSLGFAAQKSSNVVHTQLCDVNIRGNELGDIPVLNPLLRLDISSDVLNFEFSVTSVGIDDYYGFEIDGNGRFVLSNFVVTHNTTIIKSLIHEKSHIIPIGMVFSGTEDSNHFWKSVFPDTFVFNGLDMEKLDAFVRRQRLSKQYLKNPWAVLLLDDVMDDPKMLNKPFFHGMYKNGRHWSMFYLLSSQYAMDIRPAIRTNIDCTFILREPNFRNRRCIWENYASVIPDFKDFCQILDSVCTDFTSLVIMNNVQSNNWQDCVFWYKAKPVPKDWKFGCREFWEFHNDRYNNEYRESY